MNDINRQFGTKWFTFYTKVRPWLACIGALPVIIEYIQYPSIYASFWWLILYLAFSIIQPILSVIVFVKSMGDYADFVKFVKWVLLFETISISYNLGVQQFLKNEFDLSATLIASLLCFLFLYYVWYLLNVKYFNKRILPDTDKTGDIYYAQKSTIRKYTEENADRMYPQFLKKPQEPQSSNSLSKENEPQRKYGNYNIYGSDIALQKNDIHQAVSQEVFFCRKCGTKLASDSIFCHKCGEKNIFLE